MATAASAHSNQSDAGRGQTCRHCGEPVKQDDAGWWTHDVGPGSSLMRCDPVKSGKPYGLEAEPFDDANSPRCADGCVYEYGSDFCQAYDAPCIAANQTSTTSTIKPEEGS